MLKNPGVTYVSEHLLPMCPVYTICFLGGSLEGGLSGEMVRKAHV